MNKMRKLELAMAKEFGLTQNIGPYSALPTPTSIRLLEIAPTLPIVCTFKIVDLSDCPSYSALSYTWGNPRGVLPPGEDIEADRVDMSQKYLIRCGECDIEVSANCYHFLEQFLDFRENVRNNECTPELSSPDVQYIWIDAICINQDSTIEKGCQVSIMDQIYKQARKVLIWLGRADTLTKPGFEALRQAANAKTRSDDSGTSPGPLPPNIHDRTNNGLPSRRHQLPGISATQWQGLVSLYRRTWFTRAWTVQEFALANEPSIMCGTFWTTWGAWVVAALYLSTPNWTHFLFAVEHSSASKMLEDENMADICQPHNSLTLLQDIKESCYSPIVRLHEIRNWQDKSFCQSLGVSKDEFPLQVLLGSFFLSQCTLKVDRIYAYLGLVPQSKWEGLSIDYERSEEETYVQATWAMISSTKSLSILSQVEDKIYRKGSSLPSWVPDYSARRTLKPLDSGADFSFNGSSPRRYDCTKNVPYKSPRLNMPSSSLSVHGLLQGSIQCVGEEISSSSDPTHLQESEEVLSCIRKLPEDHLWRTLISNEDVLDHGQSYPASDDSRKHLFEAWIGHLSGQVEEYRRYQLARCPDHVLVPKKTRLRRLFRSYRAFTRDHQMPNVSILEAMNTEKDLSLDSICRCIDEAYSHTFRRNFGTGKQDIDLLNDFGRVMTSLGANMAERRLFTISTQRLGKGPTSIRRGDEVWILCGAKVPYVLRPMGDGEYELVGESYVHGIMHGEALDSAINEFKTVTLI